MSAKKVQEKKSPKPESHSPTCITAESVGLDADDLNDSMATDDEPMMEPMGVLKLPLHITYRDEEAEFSDNEIESPKESTEIGDTKSSGAEKDSTEKGDRKSSGSEKDSTEKGETKSSGAEQDSSKESTQSESSVLDTEKNSKEESIKISESKVFDADKNIESNVSDSKEDSLGIKSEYNSERDPINEARDKKESNSNSAQNVDVFKCDSKSISLSAKSPLKNVKMCGSKLMCDNVPSLYDSDVHIVQTEFGKKSQDNKCVPNSDSNVGITPTHSMQGKYHLLYMYTAKCASREIHVNLSCKFHVNL